MERPNQTPELGSWFRWITTSTFLKKKNNIKKPRAKPNQVCLYFVFVVIAFEYFLFLSFFQFMNKSIHIYIPLYFLSLFVILVLYMNPVDKFFLFFFLWRAFLRRYSEGKKSNQNLLGLPQQLLSRGFFGLFGSLWMSMIINPEDYCYVAVT